MPKKIDKYNNPVKSQDIFCDMAHGLQPCYKIWEDSNFFAILDIFPNTEGLTLVISKKHLSSYFPDLTESEMNEFALAIKKVSRLLERKLKVKRVHLVLEGTGINHLHAKLYPATGLKSKNTQMAPKGGIFFNKYAGYISTLSGPRADDKKLKALQKKITR